MIEIGTGPYVYFRMLPLNGAFYHFRFETADEAEAATYAGMVLDHLPSDSPELHRSIARAAAEARAFAEHRRPC